jgi:hypothetical protein
MKGQGRGSREGEGTGRQAVTGRQAGGEQSEQRRGRRVVPAAAARLDPTLPAAHRAWRCIVAGRKSEASQGESRYPAVLTPSPSPPMPPLSTLLADDFIAYVHRTRPDVQLGPARLPSSAELAAFGSLLAAARAWRPDPAACRSLGETLRRLDGQVESWEDRDLLVRIRRLSAPIGRAVRRPRWLTATCPPRADDDAPLGSRSRAHPPARHLCKRVRRRRRGRRPPRQQSRPLVQARLLPLGRSDRLRGLPGPNDERRPCRPERSRAGRRRGPCRALALHGLRSGQPFPQAERPACAVRHASRTVR